MDINLTIVLAMTTMLSLTQCHDRKNSDDNMAYYEAQLKRYEETQNTEAICNAASAIGNIQMAFPISKKTRKKLFIEHIKTGLDAEHVQGFNQYNTMCGRKLENDLIVQQTAIIRQSRVMVTCMDAKRVNGIYTSQAYDTCAEEHNYKP